MQQHSRSIAATRRTHGSEDDARFVLACSSLKAKSHAKRAPADSLLGAVPLAAPQDR